MPTAVFESRFRETVVQPRAPPPSVYNNEVNEINLKSNRFLTFCITYQSHTLI